MLKERALVWWAIFARPWVAVVSFIYGLMGLLEFFREKLLPVEYHCGWDAYYRSVMPDFSFHTWITIGLVISVVILLEGSYRLIKQRETEHLAVTNGLRSELLELTQRLDTRARFQEQKVQIAQIIYNLRASIAQFVATTSDENRSALIAVQNGAAEWLAENIGAAEAHAFAAADPCLAVPSTLRLDNSGPYQEACGRLSYLVRLVGTLGSS